MGDLKILREELELGVPLEAAAILAGYDFEELEALQEDEEIQNLIKTTDALFMHQHLQNIQNHSEVNPRMSTWLLERRFPKHFSQTSKINLGDDIPKSVTLRGVNGNNGES